VGGGPPAAAAAACAGGRLKAVTSGFEPRLLCAHRRPER